VIRTSVPRELLDANNAVGAYKSLIQVERIGKDPVTFEKLARPTAVQQRVFDLLGVKLVA
jgi:hypothetical protein